MSTRTYLPNIDGSRIWEIFRTRQWTLLEQELQSQSYERVGLDRALQILLDMRSRFGAWSGFDVLDVGCNTGLFSYALAGMGNHVTGLDSGAVNVQKLYQKLELAAQNTASPSDATFLHQDIRQFLRRHQRQWDFVLLLSVAHHWQFGYAHSGQRAFSSDETQCVMDRLLRSFRYALYYECPLHEPGFPPGYGRTMLERYATQPLHLSEVALTVGPNGYVRQLLRVERI